MRVLVPSLWPQPPHSPILSSEQESLLSELLEDRFPNLAAGAACSPHLMYRPQHPTPTPAAARLGEAALACVFADPQAPAPGAGTLCLPQGPRPTPSTPQSQESGRGVGPLPSRAGSLPAPAPVLLLVGWAKGAVHVPRRQRTKRQEGASVGRGPVELLGSQGPAGGAPSFSSSAGVAHFHCSPGSF